VTTKQHAVNIVTCPTYPEKFIRDNAIYTFHCHRTSANLQGLRNWFYFMWQPKAGLT